MLFEDLKEAGLLIHYSKLRLFRKKIKFLGYELSNNSYGILDSRRKIISNLPIPNTRAQLQSFIGIINFCSAFIDSHQILCSILYPALKQHEKFKLTPLQVDTIKHIQNQIQNAENLYLIDRNKELICVVDSSNLGVGCVIYQDHKFKKSFNSILFH